MSFLNSKVAYTFSSVICMYKEGKFKVESLIISHLKTPQKMSHIICTGDLLVSDT